MFAEKIGIPNENLMDFNHNEEGALLNLLANSLGVALTDDTLFIPPDIGAGYIRRIRINSKMQLFIRNFEFRVEWKIQRDNIESDTNLILIAFHNIFKSECDSLKTESGLLTSTVGLPSAMISSVGVGKGIIIPAHVKTSSVVIAVYSDYLKELLSDDSDNSLISTIVSGTQTFLFEEMIPPQIQDVAAEIVTAPITEQLQGLYFRAKAEQLIYLLLKELLKRERAPAGLLNVADIKTIYRVRDKILENMDQPPRLEDMVVFSAMSKSKLQTLFKQVFGNSLYNYYQSFRMRQAAQMLRADKLSVSEVGYRMGFSNLSHFTRMFEKHIGEKPKKYATSI